MQWHIWLGKSGSVMEEQPLIIFFRIKAYFLSHCSPTRFDLWAILQKHEHLQATSNKMMCKTTDSQDLKLKRKEKISECIIEFIKQQLKAFYKSLSVRHLLSLL